MGRPSRIAILTQHLTTGKSEELVLPIFVCNLAFPLVASKLHIFEPRYRLMVQQALKNNRLFGLTVPTSLFPEIPPNDLKTPANLEGMCDMGTVVRIKEHRTLPDGRILIEVVGVARFSILELAIVEQVEQTTNEPASYFTARCQVYNDDYDAIPEAMKQARQKMNSLSAKFRDLFPHPVSVFFFQKLLGEEAFIELAASLQREGGSIGETKIVMPHDLDNPEAFVWRAVDSLPIPERHKYRLLASPSAEDRAGLLLQLLDAVQGMQLQEDEDGDDTGDGQREKNSSAVKAQGSQAGEEIID
jgi:Lon protease-like protein